MDKVDNVVLNCTIPAWQELKHGGKTPGTLVVVYNQKDRTELRDAYFQSTKYLGDEIDQIDKDKQNGVNIYFFQSGSALHDVLFQKLKSKLDNRPKFAVVHVLNGMQQSKVRIISPSNLCTCKVKDLTLWNNDKPKELPRELPKI